MRILMLSPVYPHPHSPSEGVFIEQQVNALRAGGVDVELLVCKPRLPDFAARRLARYKHLQGLDRATAQDAAVRFVRYVQIPQYKLASRTISSCADGILDEIKGDGGFDLIHAQSSWPTGLAAVRVAEELERPFLVTLHIQDEPLLYEGSAKHLYRQMLTQASAVAVVGSPLARFVGQMAPHAGKRLTTIPNGVEVNIGAESSTQVRREGTERRIISVGNLWKTKGIDTVLDALAELDGRNIRNWHYTVVGGGPERPALEALAAERGLGERVVFTGALLHAQAMEQIDASDIFVLPSWSEAFGVAYLEAMACGKPAIGCHGQGAEDIIRDGQTGYLVEAKNVSELADALATLITEPELCEKMGGLGKKRAADFSWSANATRYMELYLHLARDKGATNFDRT